MDKGKVWVSEWMSVKENCEYIIIKFCVDILFTRTITGGTNVYIVGIKVNYFVSYILYY